MKLKVFTFFLLVTIFALATIASSASEMSVPDKNTATVCNIASTNQTSQESPIEQENVMLVKQVYADFFKGDLPSLLDKFADNAEWVQPGGPEVLISGVYHGRAQIAGFLRNLTADVEFTQFNINEYIARGNKVVVVGSYQARIRSTGNIYSSDFVAIFTVDAGKITGYETYHDTAAIVLASASQNISAINKTALETLRR